MDLPNEIWYNVFSFLSQRSMSKFSSLWNLHDLSEKEIELLWTSSHPCFIFDACKHGYINLVKLLIIKFGVDISVSHGFDKLIHCASRYGHKEILEFLIANGADVNSYAMWKDTPLMLACVAGHKDCAELLIANGADVNIQSSGCGSALSSACVAGHKDCIELLIANGVDVKNDDVMSELFLNEMLGISGWEDIIEMLGISGREDIIEIVVNSIKKN